MAPRPRMRTPAAGRVSDAGRGPMNSASGSESESERVSEGSDAALSAVSCLSDEDRSRRGDRSRCRFSRARLPSRSCGERDRWLCLRRSCRSRRSWPADRFLSSVPWVPWAAAGDRGDRDRLSRSRRELCGCRLLWCRELLRRERSSASRALFSRACRLLRLCDRSSSSSSPASAARPRRDSWRRRACASAVSLASRAALWELASRTRFWRKRVFGLSLGVGRRCEGVSKRRL